MNYLTLFLFLLYSFAAVASDSLQYEEAPLSVELRIREALNQQSLRAASLSLQNPALLPIAQDFSLSKAEVSYSRVHQSRAVFPQMGDGTAFGAVSADAYIKSGNSTFSGSAGYLSGVIFNMQWNESADLERVFPYVIADAVGGNMRHEQYSFAGAYSHEYNKILWGIEGGYSADLYFRNIDPRPKTITGLLHLNAGVAFKSFGQYLLGASFSFEKFRQSTDIKFVSEMGESKVYHLTGLGTFYSRFAGVGKNVYNDEYSYCGSLNFFPRSRNGFFLSGKYIHSSMDHVIVDLNRLPMANLSINNWLAEGGYMSENSSLKWSTFVDFYRDSRRGKEGVFGDPLSGSYPLIGKILTYASNMYTLSASGNFGYSLGNIDLRFSPSIGFFHFREEYLEPERFASVDNCQLKLLAGANYVFDSGIILNFDLNLGRIWNLNSDLLLSPLPNEDSETLSLEQSVRSSLSGLSSCMTSISPNLQLFYPLNNKYALSLNLQYTHQNYGIGVIANNFSSSISFLF